MAQSPRPVPHRRVAPPPILAMRASRRALLSRCLLAAAGAVAPPAFARGPSSLSGKPRPETGVVLLDPVQQNGKTISAELLIAGTETPGAAVVAVFESNFDAAKGNYYDVEARNKDGDASFIHVATLPAGARLESVPSSFFTDAALGSTGRFGSYSAPQLTSVSSGSKMGDAPPVSLPCSATRFVDVSFSALTQAGYEVPRRGVIAAVQPRGSNDVLMLVSSVGAARWKKGGAEDVRLTSESFRVTSARPSQLNRSLDNDFRYSARSLKGFSEGESEIEAAFARELSSQSGALTGKFAPPVAGF